jgi:hypothetical protein
MVKTLKLITRNLGKGLAGHNAQLTTCGTISAARRLYEDLFLIATAATPAASGQIRLLNPAKRESTIHSQNLTGNVG